MLQPALLQGLHFFRSCWNLREDDLNTEGRHPIRLELAHQQGPGHQAPEEGKRQGHPDGGGQG